MFRKKKKKPDVELKCLREQFKYDSDEEPNVGPYALNKDLIGMKPEIFVEEVKNEVNAESQYSDFLVLQDKKTFTDYFFSETRQYRDKSALVQEKEKEFEELLRLESEEGWELKMEKEFLRIYTKMDEEVPVVKALFDMRVDAEPNFLYDLLYNVEVRKAWDPSVLEYEELSRPDKDTLVYYMLNKAPWPFTNRDFVEIRYTRYSTKGDIEVFYQESNWEHQGAPGAERGQTLFAGQIFRRVLTEKGNTLLVTLVSQANLSGKIPPKALKDTLPLSLMNWYRAVRKEMMKTCPESCINL